MTIQPYQSHQIVNAIDTQMPTAADPQTAALISREAQEVQGTILSARMFPRNEGVTLKRIEAACANIKLAEHSMYEYTRGGQSVTGPSIRLAEAIAQRWGNFQAGFKVISRENGCSTIIAFAWDLETNYRKAIEFKVLHVRDTKKGSYTLTNERDIYELEANMASRRVRNCILAVIPGDVVEAAIEACERTLRYQGTVEEKRKEVVKALSEFQISVDEIERRIGKKIASLSDIDYVQLRKIWKSLKDGMSEKADWFEPILEPEKLKRAQEESRPLQTQQVADADKAAALKELTGASVRAKKRGGNPDEILGKPLSEVAAGTADQVFAAADILDQWQPAGENT
jgi:hypothetical protein